MNVCILLYDRLTALDAIGPYEVLARLPGGKLQTVAKRPGTVRTDTRALGLHADYGFDEVSRCDVVVVPGGPGSRDLISDGATLEWLRGVDQNTQWTTSVCTGSLILAAAGLLADRQATTHWACLDLLGQLGARPLSRRVVSSDKYLTAAGVSAGIDMALVLAERIAGRDVAEAIALGIEYDPEPPFDSGHPSKARQELVETVRAQLMESDY